ncbi:capsular polysaccharide synthesis protein [Moraxella sp. ZJ142]|uniref:capsular polysaccharide synthesis protein n=1 Tax=Moraxella marmotae TaxID=3344520 RepID=UPI0035D3DA41
MFYRTFLPKKIRNRLALKASIQQQQHLSDNFRKLLTLYYDNHLEKFSISAKKDLGTQKIIWQYWGQGIDDNLPEIVKICFSSVDKYKGDYQVIRLDDRTIHDYIDLPDFVWQKRQNPAFKHAFFADLLRLALLDTYGGIWADATILLTAPIDDCIKNQEFFMFQRDNQAQNQEFWQNFNAEYFGWHEQHSVNVLNSFIVGKKKNPVINHCLNILLNFWQTQNTIPHYFFFQIMFDVLIKEFIPEQNCPILDDTLPHLLQTKLTKPFDQQDYQDIIGKINIHKMTYLDRKPSQQDTYYHHLLVGYGN